MCGFEHQMLHTVFLQVLKEEVRRYKCRVKEAEQLSATQQQQLARLQAQVGRVCE